MEASEAALDMRVIRAGHDKIPLARIERRSSEAEQRSSGVIRGHQGSSEAEQSPGEFIMRLVLTCYKHSEEQRSECNSALSANRFVLELATFY